MFRTEYIAAKRIDDMLQVNMYCINHVLNISVSGHVNYDHLESSGMEAT